MDHFFKWEDPNPLAIFIPYVFNMFILITGMYLTCSYSVHVWLPGLSAWCSDAMSIHIPHKVAYQMAPDFSTHGLNSLQWGRPFSC